MKSNKETSEKLPSQNEIDKVSKEVAKREFLRLMILSDSVNRYVQLKLKDDVNWLQVIVLPLESERSVGRSSSAG